MVTYILDMLGIINFKSSYYKAFGAGKQNEVDSKLIHKTL